MITFYDLLNVILYFNFYIYSYASTLRSSYTLKIHIKRVQKRDEDEMKGGQATVKLWRFFDSPAMDSHFQIAIVRYFCIPVNFLVPQQLSVQHHQRSIHHPSTSSMTSINPATLFFCNIITLSQRQIDSFE